MSLKQEVLNAKLIEVLGSEDVIVINNARLCLTSIISADNVKLQWLQNNLKCQAELTNLKSRVFYIRGVKLNQISKQEAEMREEGELDDIRFTEERKSRFFLDTKYYDLREQENTLHAILSYCDDLLWCLKSAVSVIKKDKMNE